MYVCVCNKITERQIRDAIRNGTHSMQALQRELGVGTHCGSCAPMTKTILDSSLSEQVAKDPDRYYAA